jgi:predicted Zn-dependent protease
VVAVADLANQTGDPELDGLAGFLVTSLEQSRRLAVLTRARMLDIARHMGAPADVAVDEVLGREICRRADASVLITGAIHRIGALYAIELRALDPGRDAYLFTQRETARTKEELLDALDRLSEDARAALREPGEEIAATRIRSRDVVTGDLEAYRRYAVARDDMARLRMAEARAGLERALEADPGFALAHFELVRLGRMSELPPDVRDRHAREARRLEPRLPPRERRTLAAWIAADAGRVGEAEAAYRALATDYPSDAEVARELADLLFRGDRPAEAAPMAARAFSLEPTNLLAGYTLVRSLAWLGRGEEALAAARTARSRAPGPETAIVEAAALGALGRYAEAARAGRDAWTAGDEQGLAALVSASLRGGDLAAVEAEAARLLRRPEPDWRARAHLFLAGVAVARGQRAAALRALAAAEEAGRTGLSYPAYYAERRVQLLAALASPADLDRETALLARLDPWVAADEAAPLAWVGALGPAARAAGGLAAGSAEERSYRAALAHHAGRTAEALPVLRRLAAEHASGSLLEPLFLGELLLARGDAAGAREALSRFVRLEPESGWLAWARPRGQLALARAELALGNAAEARRIADRLAAAWAGADPDYPLAAELRAFQAALPR